MKLCRTFTSFILLTCASSTLLATTRIDTITVTAQRQASNTNDSNIVKITDTNKQQATHISEVMVKSPGTWISRGNGQEHLTAIRSPVLTGGGGCGPFLMAEDNIALRAPAFCNVNQLFDANYEQADGIEVLRGPGTAFYGTNAMHGIINIASPNFSAKPYNQITTEWENSHDYGRILAEHRTANWLLQANAADDNGYKDNSGFNQGKLRFKFLQQGENWTLTHHANLMDLKQETAGFVTGKDAYKDDERKKENLDSDAYRNASSFRYNAAWNYTINDQQHFTLTPYLRSNDMEFSMHFQPGKPIEENGHDSLGIQSAYYHQVLQNVLVSTGIDIDYSKGYLTQTQKSAGPSLNFPIGKQYDYNVNVLTSAAFVHSDYHITERLLLSTGIRFEEARYEYTNNLSDGAACNPAATRCRYSRPSDNTISFYHWSPKVTLGYEVLTNNRIYTTLASGYRAPDSSELFRLEQGQTIANIDSESIHSVELGWRGAWNEQVEYQVSAYDMHKKNVIFKDANRQNVDQQKTSHKGIEASLYALLTENLFLDIQLSYGLHRYDSNYRPLDSGTGLIKDNIIDTAPRQLHHLSLAWQALEKSRFSVEEVYVGSYYLDPDNQFNYPGHLLTNLRYQQQLLKGWELGAGVYNLFNEDYADRADITAIAPFQERYFIGEPRSYRLSISTRF